MKLDGNSCLRREQTYEARYDEYENRMLDMSHAKDECSKNQRCVGIESTYRPDQFALCLDALYKSTALDKYENMNNHLYKKLENHGNYAEH